MTASLTPFAFEDCLVRAHRDEQGNPWFVAKDVCRVLEITDHHQAVSNLEEDERGRCIIPTPSGQQEMLIISESGLYSLIFRSRKPQARAFRKWVTSEVLPAIRRTGRYETPATSLEGAGPSVALPQDLPDEARRLRPSVRAQVLSCAVQAAKMENAGPEAVEVHFLRYCQLVAQSQRPASLPQGVPPMRADEWRAVDHFAGEILQEVPGAVMRAGTLYKAFLRWWREESPFKPAPTQHVFGQAIARHYPKRKTGGEVRYHNVGLRQAS